MGDVPVPGSAAKVSFNSDHSLLARFRRGDDDAATALFLRYATRLRSLVRARTSPRLAARLDAEDVVQSVFRSFFRRAADGEYDVPPGDELWQLLLVIALNKVRNAGSHHAAQKRDVRRTEALAPTNDSEGESTESLALLRMVIDDIMQQLPEIQQEIVMLRIQGYELQEIADRSQRSLRTVERVLQGFRQRLTQVIDEPQV